MCALLHSVQLFGQILQSQDGTVKGRQTLQFSQRALDVQVDSMQEAEDTQLLWNQHRKVQENVGNTEI